MASYIRTFGKLALEPDNCWTPDQAKSYHNKFHEQDKRIERYYTSAVEALRDLPTQQDLLRTIYPKVWDFLKRWGRVQGLRKDDSREMVKSLNSHGGLLGFLRRYSLENDLNTVVDFNGENRTLANWMQIILRDVSHQRRNEAIGSTKLLHAAIPRLFPMFDSKMSQEFFGVPKASVLVYCGLFLPLAQCQIEWLRKINFKPDDSKVCAGSWAKLIDEINWTWANP